MLAQILLFLSSEKDLKIYLSEFFKTLWPIFSKLLFPFLTRNKSSLPFTLSQIFFLLSTKAAPILKFEGSLNGKGSNVFVSVLNKFISPEAFTIIALFLSYLEIKLTPFVEISFPSF